MDKEQVFLEEKASKEWEEKWGFIKDFEKLCIEVAAKRGISEEEYKRMTKMKYRSTNNGSLSLGNAAATKEMGECDVKPSGPVPKTTSGFIGWRSSDFSNNLEKFPMYVSPRHTLYPPDLPPPLPVYSIMLV
ncbi:uncharacterized protein LOC108737418 [Agrilus planipennis]|uniref:Uncharacterized protein LOC108737418 n=1 Tax=Agrilus planipennis TaxID=224129 RepID=A0A1W4X0B0_AGRPL|nr:uncharacterized protein LOC108737418 [Agrilus planipennis]